MFLFLMFITVRTSLALQHYEMISHLTHKGMDSTFSGFLIFFASDRDKNARKETHFLSATP